MNKTIVNFQLGRLKSNALKLRSYSQLPHLLCKAILSLNSESDEKIVRYLMESSEHMLRIRGYYKKYPQVEKVCEEQLRNDLNKLGYTGL